MTEKSEIDKWNELVASSQFNFLSILAISASPLLGTVLMIVISFAIITKLVTQRRHYHRQKRQKEAKNIEKILLLIIETKKERQERIAFKETEEQNSFDKNMNRSTLGEDAFVEVLEKPKQKNFTLTNLNRIMHPFELDLPDENKVPMVLLNDAIARSSAKEKISVIDSLHEMMPRSERNFIPHSKKIKIDQSVLEEVNRLIRPSISKLTPTVSKHLQAYAADDTLFESREEKRRLSEPRLSNSISLDILNVRQNYELSYETVVDETNENKSSKFEQNLSTMVYSSKVPIFYLNDVEVEESKNDGKRGEKRDTIKIFVQDASSISDIYSSYYNEGYSGEVDVSASSQPRTIQNYDEETKKSKPKPFKQP